MTQSEWQEELITQLLGNQDRPLYFCLNLGMGDDEKELMIQEVRFEDDKIKVELS